MLALNPSAFNYQVPSITKSDGLIKRQYQHAFDASTGLLDTQMRPSKRPKVSAKAKKADENCLSAAAIVDPLSVSTDKDTTNIG